MMGFERLMAQNKHHPNQGGDPDKQESGPLDAENLLDQVDRLFTEDQEDPELKEMDIKLGLKQRS